jgi:phosphoribosylformylglycinamidine cyclo-ligase
VSDAGRPGDRAPLTYESAGVAASHEEENLLGRWITRTFGLNAVVPQLPLGYFANVLPLSAELGLAISTDGVGTKLLVAQDLDRYDTVGIDCVAMNANDILCVGARPISLVDYVAVERADPAFLGEIARGLYEGARRARISIPGGEIAQVQEMIRGRRPGRAFDLVGTCVGTVHPARVIVGRDVRPGDVVVGLESSGVHSNGLTLARRVLFERAGLKAGDPVAELGRSVGEELLEPTHIYVPEVLAMLDAGLRINALVHVTGDGFFNLLRIAETTIGFVLDALPEPPPIFSLIRRHGGLDDAEMFRVYNMGVGFCVVVDPADAGRVSAIAAEHGRRAAAIGYAVRDPERRLRIPAAGLVGAAGRFERSAAPPPERPRA